LSQTIFIDLNQRAIKTYDENHPRLKTRQDHRLCAIDGSKLRLPNSEAIVNEFGVTTGKEGSREYPMALAPVYYDVTNKLAIDSSINPTRASERECAASHLELTQPDHLSILGIKQFNPKTVTIESGTVLVSIRQSSVIKPYSYYIGLDVHKDTIAISIASADSSQPRYYGEIANTSKAIVKLVKKLNPDGEVLAFCYEAGPCGYVLYRQLTRMGTIALSSHRR
jgi:hypothetical protein